MRSLKTSEIAIKRVNYMIIGQLLEELGYIPSKTKAESVERELLYELWALFEGEKR